MMVVSFGRSGWPLNHGDGRDGAVQQLSWEFGKYLIGSLTSALVGYLIGAFTKVSKVEHQKAAETLERHLLEKLTVLERQLEKQADRSSKFESALGNKADRTELKESVLELKSMLAEMRAEVRKDFLALLAEIQKRRD